jgi:hypothetical protein
MTPRQGLTAPAMDRHPAKSHDPEAHTDDQPTTEPSFRDVIEAALGICDVCGAKIAWAKTEKGRNVPLDLGQDSTADPESPSRFVLSVDHGRLVAHYLDRFDRRMGKPGNVFHGATCEPNPRRARAAAKAREIAEKGGVARLMFPGETPQMARSRGNASPFNDRREIRANYE